VVAVIDPAVPERFLALRRVALAGATDDERSFARTVQRELEQHGMEVVPVNPSRTLVAGAPCFPDVASVPGDLDGVIVMTPPDRAADVVRACVARGVGHVWLFRGVGAGSVSDEAIELCHEHGVEVVEGACPLMFLEPVGWIHRLHRGVKHLNRSLARRTAPAA
jgi:predicted CoA-binding protein